MKFIAYTLIFVNFGIYFLGAQEKVQSKIEAGQSYSTVKALSLLNDGKVIGLNRCFLLGEFESAATMRVWYAGLGIGGLLDVKEFSYQYERAPRFRVYVPPFETQIEAVRYSQQLKEMKIDNYVVVGSDANNAVSLGVFENIDKAKRLQRVLLSKNVNAVIVKMPRQGESFWLGFRLKMGESRDFKKRVSEYSEFTKDLLEISCKSVDS